MFHFVTEPVIIIISCFRTDEKETKALTSHEESSGGACCLLNLLLQYQDTLSLFWWQHGDLFWGQLQDLHNQGSLGMWKHST